MEHPGDRNRIEDRSAVVLLSGGIDSCVTLELAKRYGWDLIALTVNYGQSHLDEIQAARAIAVAYDLEHLVIEASLRTLAPSRLTGLSPATPRTLDEIRQEQGPNPAFVPGRNTILLSMAMAAAQARKRRAVLIGATLEDHAGFADCRPFYFEAFETMATVATEAPFKIIAPLVQMRKIDVVRVGLELKAPLHLTLTCYYPTERKPCGRCDACLLRAEAFEAVGVPDPCR